MTWERLCAALDAWRTRGATRLTVGGREPVLHPEFVHLVRYARAAGFTDVTTVTGGSPATARQLRAVSPSEISAIGLRVSGASPAAHDRVHGPGAFATAAATGAELAERGFVVRVLCAVDRFNVHDVVRLIELADGSGMSGATFYLAPSGRREHGDARPPLGAGAWVEFYRRVRPHTDARQPATPAWEDAACPGHDLAGWCTVPADPDRAGGHQQRAWPSSPGRSPAPPESDDALPVTVGGGICLLPTGKPRGGEPGIPRQGPGPAGRGADRA